MTLTKDTPTVVVCETCDHRYLSHVEKCGVCGRPNPTLPPPGPSLEKWDARFLQAAALFASWSKDPSTKVGAAVVDHERRIVGVGYNGFPRGVEDTSGRLDDRKQKYSLTVHAELNAILNCTLRPEGKTLYVYPLPPCPECTKAIIQSGIRRVVIGLAGKGENNAQWAAMFEEFSVPMLKEAGVKWETWEIDLV